MTTLALAEPAATSACAHCGALLARAGDRFCCRGCAAAYELVSGLGLGQYYARRTATLAAPPEMAEPSPGDVAAYVRSL